MSLENYLVKSQGHYAEIQSEFRPEEVERLYNRIREIGFPQYCDFVVEHLQDIVKYISLTQSQRQQKKWVNHPDGLLIRLAAIQISYATDEFLRDIEPISYVVDRGSYREFRSVVSAGLAAQLVDSPFSLFPFEGYENPFPYFMKV